MAQSPGAASGIVCRPTKVMLCNQETYHDDLHKFYIDQQKLNREAALAFQGQQQRVANLETRTNSLESAMSMQKKINYTAAKMLEDLQAEIHGQKNSKGRQKQKHDEENLEKICDDCGIKMYFLTQLMDQQCRMCGGRF